MFFFFNERDSREIEYVTMCSYHRNDIHKISNSRTSDMLLIKEFFYQVLE